MHPVIIQAVAAEHRRDMHEDAAARRRVRQIRRSRQTRRLWLFMRATRAGRPELSARAVAAARSGGSLRPSSGAMPTMTEAT